MENSNVLNKVIKIILITLVVLVGLGIAGLYAAREVATPFDMPAYNSGIMSGAGSLEKNDSALPASPKMRSQNVIGGQPLMTPAPELSQDASNVTDKKVIKNGNLSLRVDNVDKSANEIAQIAKNNDGDVFSSNFYQGSKNTKSGTITVKVPVKNFEKTFSELKDVATLVIRESTFGSDVTQEYVDLQAQLKNKQIEEEAFQKIMDQAQKIDDILAVQTELSRVRGEIEQLQGQIKYLDSQTDMSVITVSLSEDANIAIVDRWRPLQVAKESINNLVKKVQNFIDFVIQLIITIIPVLVLYGILVWVVYKIGRIIYTKFRS